jgi:hypothetical protein
LDYFLKPKSEDTTVENNEFLQAPIEAC